MEDILESLAGPWGWAVAAAFVLLPDGRKALRSVFKTTLKAGYCLTDTMSELVAEAKEEADKSMSEADDKQAQAQATARKKTRHPELEEPAYN